MNIGKAIKNIGSTATDAAMGKAQRVAMGTSRSVNPAQSHSPMPMGKRRIHPGSSAGLRVEKTVRLESNTAGYANKANQRARYRQKPPIARGYQITTSLGFPRQSRTFDSRVYGDQSGSIGLLKERM